MKSQAPAGSLEAPEVRYAGRGEGCDAGREEGDGLDIKPPGGQMYLQARHACGKGRVFVSLMSYPHWVCAGGLASKVGGAGALPLGTAADLLPSWEALDKSGFPSGASVFFISEVGI